MPDFFQPLASPLSFGLVTLGAFLGITVGAIPGLTGAMLIALTLPLTFSMEPAHALILLTSMYVGSVSGGLITATLLRIPGTPASVMTTLDGYPMAKSGRPGRALGLGIGASLVGGIISWVFLWSFAEPLADFSTKLGPFDYFAMTLLALALIAGVGGSSPAKGWLAGFFGMFCALPGAHPSSGEPRLTFGFVEMDAGFRLLPVLIGVFALGKILRDLQEGDSGSAERIAGDDKPWLSLQEWRSHFGNLFRSSCIGSFIGALPGVGANVGSLAAYSTAKRFSSKPEEFGKGSPEGIVASESANNATVGGALIPLVSLGIPGSVIDAILLGALLIHGLQPGPLLFRQNPEAVHAILGAALVANVLTFAFMTVGARRVARLAKISPNVLIPFTLVFCVVGSFALNNRWFDVWTMLAFGVIGFLMEKAHLPLAAFVIGFVLAPLAEKNLCSGLGASGGSYLELFTQPISLVFLLLAVTLVLLPLRAGKVRDSSSTLP